ncbi:MAG: hypothetical protein SV598_12075 [Pseudomonadota bacterium]|nr:hypothetical protein [Pseudomonadota bacterium]
MADNGVHCSVEAAQDLASFFKLFIDVEVFPVYYLVSSQKRVETEGIGIGYLHDILNVAFVISKDEYIFSMLCHVFRTFWKTIPSWADLPIFL